VLSRAVLRRLVPLAAAGAALACAVLPASAHTGQDDRPGAVQVDLEVLVTPPVTGETTPGGQDPSVSVDSHGNVLATALKEDGQAATVDGRAPTHVRAGSWRWSSGDDGDTFTNVSGRPVQADGLVPGGRSVAAAADDRGRGYLLEAHDGVGLLTVTRSTEQDDVVVENVVPLPAAALLGRTMMAAHGDGHVLLLATPRTGPTYVGAQGAVGGYSLYRSDDAGASFADLQGVDLDGAEHCGLGVGHAPGSKQVVVACTMSDGSVAAFRSFDDGRTVQRSTILKADPSRVPERPSVAVGRDGTTSVVVVRSTASGERSTMSLLRSRTTSRTWTRQEVATEPGRWSGASLAVNGRGRLGLAAYHLAPGPADRAGAGWHVRLAVFTAGRTPLYVDFASHDPVAPPDFTTAPDNGTALAAGPDNRFHLLWTNVKVPAPGPVSGTPLLRNIWSVRTLST
jgi:hypothetical protein